MFCAAVVLTLSTAYLGYRFYRYYTFDIYFKDIPTEFSYPIIGNAFKLGFSPAEYLKNLVNWWEKFDHGIFKIKVGPQTLLMITDADDVEVILSSTTNIEKMDEYRFFSPWLGNGLITSKGDVWHAHRKMITPSFHFKILNNFLYTINDNSVELVKILKEKANETTFDCGLVAKTYAMDVICETAMGIKLNSMFNHDSKLLSYYSKLSAIIAGRVFSVLKRVETLFRFTDDYKQQTKILRYTNKFIQNVISERKVLLMNKNKEETRNDIEFYIKNRLAFLDTLLTATINDRPLTDKQISDEVSTFMSAGHETLAIGISFILYCLSIYPELQTKVFDELFNIFGNDVNRCPTFQEIQDMHYLNMFIKECQRLYTTLPLFGRKLSQPLVLSGREIPAGASVMIFSYAMHMNPKVFLEPKKFIPERFSLENRKGKHPYEYLPFSAGPRNCIGQRFATIELKSAISAIVRNYVILPAGDTNFKPILGVALLIRSDNGILIKLKPRVYE